MKSACLVSLSEDELSPCNSCSSGLKSEPFPFSSAVNFLRKGTLYGRAGSALVFCRHTILFAAKQLTCDFKKILTGMTGRPSTFAYRKLGSAQGQTRHHSRLTKYTTVNNILVKPVGDVGPTPGERSLLAVMTRSRPSSTSGHGGPVASG